MYFIKSMFLFVAIIFSFDLFSQEQINQQIKNRFNRATLSDTIKVYYESGLLKSLYIPYKKKYKYKDNKFNYCLYIEYNENGKCLRYADDRIGYEQKYDDNGDCISYMIYNRKKSELKFYIEFYHRSTKKTIISNGNRFDYDEKERIKRYWERKNLRHDKRFDIKVATIYFQEYDVYGDVKKSGRFYTSLNEHDSCLHITLDFPEVIDSVPMQDFKEIDYPCLKLKEIYKWDYNENKTIISRYERQGDNWTIIRRRTFPHHSKNGLPFYFKKY